MRTEETAKAEKDKKSTQGELEVVESAFAAKEATLKSAKEQAIGLKALSEVLEELKRLRKMKRQKQEIQKVEAALTKLEQ